MASPVRRTGLLLLVLLLHGSWNSFAYACGTKKTIYLNTSNENKLQEFKSYLPQFTLVSKAVDLSEPLADKFTVIQYKASQFNNGVLVDDVSLEVEGVEIGINIKWLIQELHKYSGRKATFSCLLGMKEKNQVKIYQGTVEGVIVPPKGSGFGIGPFFLPKGGTQTLGEYMDPQYNPRFLAIQKFLQRDPFSTLPLLRVWQGEFQNPGSAK